MTRRECIGYKVPDSRFHNNSNSNSNNNHNNNCNSNNDNNNNNNERATTATDGSRPPGMKYSLCTTCTGYIYGVHMHGIFLKCFEKIPFSISRPMSAQRSRVRTQLVFYMTHYSGNFFYFDVTSFQFVVISLHY